MSTNEVKKRVETGAYDHTTIHVRQTVVLAILLFIQIGQEKRTFK